jgi:Polyketide cyclase / dehydrase and lipid transport
MAIELACEADISCAADRIFDLITDLRGQGGWLSESSAFKGTEDISSGPVAKGTTYREPGPLGVRDGVVTEFERPTVVTFHQPMTLKLHAGVLDITLRYTLTAQGPTSTHVRRVCSLTLPAHLKVLAPIFVRAFRAESGRTLEALKAHADTLG